MPRGESLYHQYPGYEVTLQPNPQRTRVAFHGEVVADSNRTLLVHETKHAPVTYFPREDVRMELLVRTQHTSFCPFKGEASYWTLQAVGKRAENAVWSYEDPFEQVAGLRDYVAFYPDRVEIELD